MKDTGGSAFPLERKMTTREAMALAQSGQTPHPNATVSEKGMTLRDYFAAKADSSGQCPRNQYEHEACAEWAFARADAMLKERVKP